MVRVLNALVILKFDLRATKTYDHLHFCLCCRVCILFMKGLFQSRTSVLSDYNATETP